MRWLVELAAGALALVGLWVTVDKTAAGVVRAWGWLRRDRVTPLLEDEHWTIAGKCEACWAENDGEGCDWAMCGCACHDDDLEELPPELPPEQSAAALGFGAERERRAAPWEAFQRIQYEAMGFEFPSGLMARVRELTP